MAKQNQTDMLNVNTKPDKPNSNVFEEERLMDSKESYDDTKDYYLARDRVFRFVIFENTALAQYLVDVVVGKGKFKVLRGDEQFSLLSKVYGKAVFLDFLGVAKDGRLCNIEIQLSKESRDNLFKRMREYQAQIDAHQLKAGQLAVDLKDLIIIFFCKQDVGGKGLPLYEYRLKEVNTGKWTDCGVRYFCVNLEYKGLGSELGRLIADFSEKDPAKIHGIEIKKALELAQERGPEEINMTREEYLEHYSEKRAAERYHKGRAEGYQKGRAEGYQKGRDEVIASLIRGTESPDAEIARLIGVPEQEVREIRERISRQ